MVDSGQFNNLVQPSSCEQVNSMCNSLQHYMIHIKLNSYYCLLCDIQVFYVPCMYQRRFWYVIPITPRSRSIFADTNIKTLADPPIPSQEDANDDAVEVEESQPFPITHHSEEEGEEEDEDGEDDDDSIGDDVEDESISI